MTTYSEYLRTTVPRQYGYTNISDFIDRKGKLYDKMVGDAVNALTTEVYDIDTCSVQALRNFWAKLYNVNPEYTNLNDGTTHVLTDEEMRLVVKLRAFASCWDGTTYVLNAFMRKLYRDRGNMFVRDDGDMQMYYVFFFQLPSWELSLYNDYDVLPRNAGVRAHAQYVSPEVMGFDGSELYGLNQRPFFNYGG